MRHDSSSGAAPPVHDRHPGLVVLGYLERLGSGAVGLVRRLASPVLLAFVVSRVVAVGSLLLGGSTHLGQPSTVGLTGWDGHWYLLIVRSGYGPRPVAHHWSRWPFFPLLPGTARVLEMFGVPPRWGLVIVANVAFVIGLAGVWRLASQRCSRRVAVLAVWIVALAPFASVFSMAYPSSLLLAGSAWAFVFLHDRRYLAAGAAAMVATLARPNGIVVVVALAVAICCEARATHPAPTGRLVIRRLVMACGPGAMALTIWCALLGRWTGNPFVFWTAKRAWSEVTVVRLIHTWPGDATLHVIVGVLALAAIALVWRQLPPAWLVFAGLYLLPSFAFGLVGLGRYAGECFPAVIAASIVLARAPRHLVPVVLTASAAAMAALAVVVTTEGIIP